MFKQMLEQAQGYISPTCPMKSRRPHLQQANKSVLIVSVNHSVSTWCKYLYCNMMKRAEIAALVLAEQEKLCKKQSPLPSNPEPMTGTGTNSQVQRIALPMDCQG